jgi:RNA polymerase sigma factor (sigma-70 family)
MEIEPENSVTRLIGDLTGDDPEQAAQRLWERYFDQLVHLARARLGSAPRGPIDAEDVALNALESLCRGVAAGRFPRLNDRSDLWRLLATLTARKSSDQLKREGRRKRGGGRVLAEADVDAPGTDRGPGGLDQLAGSEPTPEFAAMMTEDVRRLFGLLPDESLRVVALLKMEGYTNEEVASSLGCALRSVERKLERIRDLWSEEAPE